MSHRRTTLSKFIIEDQRRRTNPDPELSALLNDIQTACKFIASAVSRGSLSSTEAAGDGVLGGALDFEAVTNDILLRECEWGGQLCGLASAAMEAPHAVPSPYPRGRYLLVFDALDGSLNLDVNVTVGTIFSVLRAPEGVTNPAVEDFLQPGTQQLAAGFALYGPASTLVLTLGAGVYGFTLEREIGAYMLTHPSMRIPEETHEFAINPAGERFWESPVRHYVEECTQGATGPRGADFGMRWVASEVAELYRLLVRGGLYMRPRDTRDSASPELPRLLHEANPMALIVEQAGGAASTGRERILDLVPSSLHQRVPMIVGSLHEVERLQRYHATFDGGESLTFETPLFNARSLFR